MRHLLSSKSKKVLLFKKYISDEFGMSPYNAAIKASFTEKQAREIEEGYKVLGMMSYSLKDVCDQEQATDRKIIRRLAEMSGIVENVEGVTKVISATMIQKNSSELESAHSMTKDFINVPDEDLRFRCLSKLIDIRHDSFGNNITQGASQIIVNVAVRGAEDVRIDGAEVSNPHE
ncbi:MAG: hypothetical protein WC373_00780 [Smithella sp.]|jgi:hypothetical protein